MATKTKSSTPVVTSTRLPKGAARPSSCGAYFTTFGGANGSAEGCKRLPRHHGDHVTAKPVGLLTSKQREALRAAKVAAKPKAQPKPKASVKGSKVVTGPTGTKFRISFGKDGEAIVTPVRTVKVLAEAPSERVVAASTRRSKTVRRVNKPTESAAMRRAGHVTKTEPVKVIAVVG